MTTNRHPDIEIYIKNCSVSTITDWLRSRFDNVEEQPSSSQIHNITVTHQGKILSLMIHEKAVGKAWTSVWFRSDSTPWERDLDCAAEASEQLHTQVRCIANGWSEGDDPDEWWRIENGAVEKIQWSTD